MTLPAEAIESGDRTYYWGALVPNVEKVNGVPLSGVQYYVLLQKQSSTTSQYPATVDISIMLDTAASYSGES